MNVIDNFLPENVFRDLQKYCNKNEFQIISAGEKEFSVMDVPENLLPFIKKDGYDIILAFIRSAYSDFDNTDRIHCDGIIMNRKTDLASVLYINEKEGVTENGTKFYTHELHGDFLSEEVGEEEFNRLILEDSADLSKWKETYYVKSEPNRLIQYDANYFHGKYPAKIEEGTRIVLVVFYARNR